MTEGEARPRLNIRTMPKRLLQRTGSPPNTKMEKKIRLGY